MFRLVALSLPLVLASAPTLAQTATAPARASAPVMVANPGNMACMFRMMDLNLMTIRASKDEKRSAEDRAKSQTMADESYAATMYYVGLLGQGYFKQNRSAEGEKEFTKMRAMPKEQLAREMMTCLADAVTARKTMVEGMKKPAA